VSAARAGPAGTSRAAVRVRAILVMKRSFCGQVAGRCVTAA
jgi:hypothetical protein